MIAGARSLKTECKRAVPRMGYGNAPRCCSDRGAGDRASELPSAVLVGSLLAGCVPVGMAGALPEADRDLLSAI